MCLIEKKTILIDGLLYEGAVWRATTYLHKKCICNNTLVIIVKESGEYDVKSFTSRIPNNFTYYNAIFQRFKEIHSIDDLKENFERMRVIGKIKLKEFHINKQKEEIAKEFM